MADTGAYAQGLASQGKGQTDLEQLVSQLALRPVAYYEPTPNMLRGGVTMELRPDIMPGNRFTFAPRTRDGQQWTFYIEAVEHSMTFGGRAETSLTLARGLPKDTYSDQSLLVSLHTGNASRVNGVLQAGLPSGVGPGLQPLNTQTEASLLAGLAGLFSAPRN